MQRHRFSLLGIAAALAVGGATLLAPVAASACGGFFCNRSQPVDQTGEHIFFAYDEDENTVEAQVLINYAGPSDEFAWIVPTPTNPEIGLSSFSVFARLNNMLTPRFQLNWSEIGSCTYDDIPPEDSAVGDGAGGDDRDSGVTVVEERAVGPYDTVTLQATDAEILIEWLQDNGYDLPDDITPFVAPYIEMGGDVHFVAFKLQSDRESGDIQPITLKYESSKPMIPIQLTAVATQPDLGVTVNVLGPYRAVPENYLHVEINFARLDWLMGGSNYNELIIAAMDEAGGQGFRTEFAGESVIMDGMFFEEGRYDKDALAGAANPYEFMEQLRMQGFMGDAQMLNLWRRYLPPPTDTDERSFYNCLECYSEHVDGADFDARAFTNELWATIVEPLEHAEDLVDTIPYLSRLYSTLSAEEMTLDPVFAFNPDMDDQSNVHIADAIVDCGDGGEYYTSPIIIRLEDGREIVTGYEVPRDDLDAMPAADSYAETGASGQPREVHSNRESIDVAIADYNASVGESFLIPHRQSRRRGCAVGAGTPDVGLLGLALVGLAFVRRRR